MARRPQRGDPLAIDARDYGDLLALLEQQQGVRVDRPLPGPSGRDVVLVRNDTGSNLDRYYVVGVGAPIVTPTLNLSEFQRRPIMSGGAPASGKVAILLEPLPDERIGRAAVSGAVPVQIDVSSAADSGGYAAAEAKSGDATQLELVQTGSLKVLWRETGTGTKWALVVFRDVAAASSSISDSGPLGSWTFNPSAGSSPSAGEFSFDDPDSTAATVLYVHVSNDEGEDVTNWLNRAFGVHVHFPAAYTPGPALEFFVADVTAVSVAASVATLTIANILNNDSLDANAGFVISLDVSPLTNKGDLFTFGTGPARLAIGSNDALLFADSAQTTGNKWLKIGSVTEQSSPGSGDLLLGESSGTGNANSFDVANLTSVSNAGGGAEVAKAKAGIDHPHRTLQSSDGSLTVTENTNDIDLVVATASTGGWVKVTKTHTDFQTAGTTNDISIYTLPAGGVIHAVKLKPATAFAGTGIATYNLNSIGVTGDTGRYYQGVGGTGFDLAQTVDDTVGDLFFGNVTNPRGDIDDHAAGEGVRAFVESTGADLDQSTAGSLTFWLYVSVAA